MQITFQVALPANYRTRRNYVALTEALTAVAGEWISIPLSDVRGTCNKDKQTTIIQAATQRGLKVETTCGGGLIYVRLRPEGGR